MTDDEPEFKIPNDSDVSPEDIQPGVNLEGADLSEAELDEANLVNASLQDADLTKASLNKADLSEASLYDANLSDASLLEADLTRAYLGAADLREASLYSTNLTGASLDAADLTKASLEKAELTEASLEKTDLTHALLVGAELNTALLKDSDLTDAQIISADLSNAVLENADLTDAFLPNADLTDANLRGADLTRAQFLSTDLSGSDLTDTTAHHANFEKSILSRATLFDADLRGAELHGSILGAAQIDAETEFLGPPEGSNLHSPHTRAAIFSKLCCRYDPKYDGETDSTDEDKAKSVYQSLEAVASRAGQSRLQSQCFVRRQDIQKDIYKETLINGPSPNRLVDSRADQTTPVAKSTLESRFRALEIRCIAGLRYARAKTARLGLLYGESPWRVVLFSVLYVISISFVLPFGEWLRPIGGEPITYGRILADPSLSLDLLYFSTLTFTTLGMGYYEPLGFGQAIATLNTATGAILIALLVFVLGRRAAR